MFNKKVARYYDKYTKEYVFNALSLDFHALWWLGIRARLTSLGFEPISSEVQLCKQLSIETYAVWRVSGGCRRVGDSHWLDPGE